ncbi:hypothetical protein LCGC14_1675750 [marine sediment metagenome]|uniref:Uncharacterized protein n=1 Tax=marine sediment metagenome TaxID=412755 RepID=A0A0F9HQ34_9ZZZZ
MMDEYYHIIEVLEGGKRSLESLGLTHKLMNHIHKAKEQIGIMPMDLLRFQFDVYMDYAESLELTEEVSKFNRESSKTWGIPTKFYLEDMYT